MTTNHMTTMVRRLLFLASLTLPLFFYNCANDDPAGASPNTGNPDTNGGDPTGVTIDDETVTIAENPIEGLALVTMTATSTSSDPIVYSIASQSPAGAMAINDVSGEVTVLDSTLFDFEVNPTLRATIEAESDGISATATIDVTLTDVDENPVSITAVNLWQQLGSDIPGETSGTQFGWAVSLNSNGSVLAVGDRNNGGNGAFAGHVRIYRLNAGSWDQIGSDIDGEAAGDRSGYAVSLSDDGTIVAIGSRNNAGTGSNAGHVRVFENIADVWTQIGSDIDAEAAEDLSGHAVSLSGDGSRVAIGSPFNAELGTKRGHVRIFENVAGTWTQVGSDIDGEADFDESGTSVSLNSDGTVVAIGAPENDGNGAASGHVRVYQELTGTWTQVGSDIDGEDTNNESGISVSLSDDGNTVAIGANLNSVNTFNEGHVRVYENQSGSWVQIGADIDGEAEGDQSGWSVSLSGNGRFVAIGTLFNSPDDAPGAGHIRVYRNNSGTWEQEGEDIDGTIFNERFGIAVSIDTDGHTVAGGAIGFGAGAARVYSIPE